MAYDVFKFLLESEIGVAFVTKGRIPERHRNLLAAHAPLVQGRIGLITLDPGTAAAFEPARGDAGGPACASGRIDRRKRPDRGAARPDSARRDRRRGLLGAALRGIGPHRRAQNCRQRPLSPAGSDRIAAAAHRGQADAQRMLDRFAGGEPLAIHAGNSRVVALPASARLEIMERLKSIAHRYGLEVLVCACKNPDISSWLLPHFGPLAACGPW